MLGFDLRAAKAVWTAVLILLLVYACYLVRGTVLIFALAVFFAYLIAPLVNYLQRFQPPRTSRTASLAVVYLLIVGLLAVVGTLIGARVVEESSHLAQQLPAVSKPEVLVAKMPLPRWAEPARARLTEFTRSQVASSADQIVPFARNAGRKALEIASNSIYIVLIPILSFFLLNDAELIRRNLLYWFAGGGVRNRLLFEGILTDLHFLLAHYIRAVLLLSCATFVFYGSVLYFLGVPYAVLLAAASALFEFIPFLGPLLAIAAVLVVAVATGYPHILWLLIFFPLYRIFQDYVLSPYLMSEGVELHPLLVIFGVFAGEEIGGVAGMFLSIPLLAAAKVIANRIRQVSSTVPAT